MQNTFRHIFCYWSVLSLETSRVTLFYARFLHLDLRLIEVSFFLQHRADNTVQTIQGLEAVNYKFEKNSLDNGIHDEANKCFCRNGELNVHFHFHSRRNIDRAQRVAILNQFSVNTRIS